MLIRAYIEMCGRVKGPNKTLWSISHSPNDDLFSQQLNNRRDLLDPRTYFNSRTIGLWFFTGLSIELMEKIYRGPL